MCPSLLQEDNCFCDGHGWNRPELSVTKESVLKSLVTVTCFKNGREGTNTRCPSYKRDCTERLDWQVLNRDATASINWAFATCKSSVMHLICPPPPPIPSNFFYFSRVLQPSQEKLKTKLMQKFFLVRVGGRGKNKVHYERCASGECIITGENLTGIN